MFPVQGTGEVQEVEGEGGGGGGGGGGYILHTIERSAYLVWHG